MIRPHKVYLTSKDTVEIHPPVLQTELFQANTKMSAVSNNTAQEAYSLKPPEKLLPDKPTDYYANVPLPPNDAEDTTATENLTGKVFNPYAFVDNKLKCVNWKNDALAVLLYIKNSVDPQIVFVSQDGTLYFKNEPLIHQAPLELILQGLLDKKKNKTSAVAAGEMQLLNVLSTAPGPIKQLINRSKINLFEPDMKHRLAAQTRRQVREGQTELNKTITTSGAQTVPNNMKALLKRHPKKITSMMAAAASHPTKIPSGATGATGFTTKTAITKANRMIVAPQEKKPWFYLN